MGKLYIKNKKKLFVILILITTMLVILFSIIYISVIYNKNQKVEIFDKKGNKIKTNNISTINKYIPQNDINKVAIDPYFNQIQELLEIDNYEELYKVVNQDYIKKNGFNKDTLKKYLIDNEYISKFVGITSARYCIQNNGAYVYRMKCFSMSKKKYYINVIETNPFEYTIDFSQEEIPTLDVNKHETSTNELKFEMTELYRTSGSIAIQLKVTNISDKEIQFYFNSISDMELNLQNGEKIKQATAELSSQKYIINKDSYFIKKFYFPLDMQYHSSIKGMTFYNVRFEDSNKNITISF